MGGRENISEGEERVCVGVCVCVCLFKKEAARVSESLVSNGL